MAAAYEAQVSNWATAIRQRRKALVQRLAMGAACALVFSPVLGWQFTALWTTGYFLIQLTDMVVFGRINSGKADSLGPVGDVLGCAMLAFNALAFGSVSIPLWLIAGPVGGVCATLLLTAGAIYSVINAPESRRVLACTASAQFFYLLLTPVFLLRSGADSATATTATVAVLVFLAFCLNSWQRLNASRAAEQAARLEAERKRAEAEAVMASRAAFLAAVGHDLRTPIGAIMSGAQELEGRARDRTSQAHAALIGEAGLMMKALLDDLLDHAKLEAGRMTVDASAFNLRAVLAQTLRFWQGEARRKGLTLKVEGAAQTPDWVQGDPVRLRQILNNLISNALKFTHEGGVSVRVRAWDEEPGGYGLLIDVRDTGPGMDASQVARLFTPFDQTQDGVSARHGGTGLGLSISRELASLMGGRLTARSAPGQGAVFTLGLTLPKASMGEARIGLEPESRGAIRPALAEAPAPAPLPVLPPEPAPVEMAVEINANPIAATPTPQVTSVDSSVVEAEAEVDGGRPLNVLVVDDHEINRRAIQLILAPLGAVVTQAEDGLAGLRAANLQTYDVIFMDVRMPELDGRETTRRLRAEAGPNQTTPVVAVTADTAKEDVEACLGAGMNYFVSKPLTPAALLGALQAVLSAPEEAGTVETAAA